MKVAGVITLSVVGSLLVIGGGTMFALGVANTNKNNPITTHEHEVELFNKMSVDIHTADLELKASEDLTYKVVCEEKEKIYHTVEVKEGVLTINTIDERAWYERIFDFSWTKMKVTVYAPGILYESANIKNATGNIIIPAEYKFNDLTLYNATGNIHVKSDVLNKLEASVSTGNILVESHNKTMDLKSSTGNITLTNVIAEEIKAKSSTGNIKFTDSDATSLIDVEASTGNIDLSLLTGKTFEAQSSTGKVRVPESTPSAPVCKAKTSTGNITITVK